MNTIRFKDGCRGYFDYAATDPNFIRLFDYIRQCGIVPDDLIDPSFKKGKYRQKADYYYSKQDDLYFYFTFNVDEHLEIECFDDGHLEEDCLDCYRFTEDGDYFDPEPTAILLNTLYGIMVALNYVFQYKLERFTIRQQDKRYIFQDHGIKPIIVDPDLGYLYNDTIPRTIVRKINNTFFSYKTLSIVNNGLYLRENLTKQKLELICKLITKNYNPMLLIRLSNWSKQRLKKSKNESFVFNDVRISNQYDILVVTPKKQQTNHEQLEVRLTTESLIKFLQTWESRLKFSDAFTLVLLGSTLRFFEGEPLP